MEQLMATLAVAFGHVHGGVGVSQQLVRGDVGGGGGGDADAGVGKDLLMVQRHRFAQGVEQLVRDRLRAVFGGVLQ
jgi:hypothetical protein